MKKIIIFLFTFGAMLIGAGVLSSAKVSAVNSSDQTIIKVTSKNPNKKLFVNVAYRTPNGKIQLVKTTPYEKKINGEFLDGSFSKLSGEGEIKVEIYVNSTGSINKKRFYLWGEGNFIDIRSQVRNGKKLFLLSANEFPSESNEKIKQTLEKVKFDQDQRFSLALKDNTHKYGYVYKTRKKDFIFVDQKNGLFSSIQYTQVKNIDKWQPLSGNAKLAKNPSIKSYWENFFARTLNGSTYGYSYAVYHKGQPVAVSSYGYDRLPKLPEASGVPMTPHTLIQIASVSKPITAVALLHLLEQNGISIDTKIWTILKVLFPNSKPGKGVDQITIAQLLSHKSGYKFGYVETPRLKNLRSLLSQPVPEEIGNRYRYSNINFSIARTLIETISGKDYEQYVRENIFSPVGAENIRLRVDKDTASHVYLINDPKGEALTIDFRDEAGAYGWYATAEDIAKFAEGVRSNKYLSPKMTKLMFEKGLGWGIRRTSAGKIYRHEGQWVIDGNKGIHSGISIFPNGTVAILLINTNSGFSASGLLVRAFSENYPNIRGYPYPGNRANGIARVEIPSNSENVRCTSDGSEPNSFSAIYTKPIIKPLPLTVKCQGFIGDTPITFVNTLELFRKGKK